MTYKFNWDSKVKVSKIENGDKAAHLKAFIGKGGEIVNRIALTKDLNKYKLKFDDGEQHYFNEDELEEI